MDIPELVITKKYKGYNHDKPLVIDIVITAGFLPSDVITGGVRLRGIDINDLQETFDRYVNKFEKENITWVFKDNTVLHDELTTNVMSWKFELIGKRGLNWLKDQIS